MPRTPEALMMEAGEWYAVCDLVLELNRCLGAIGDDASGASVNALEALARDGVNGALEAQGDALTRVLERVVKMQTPVLALVKLAGDRMTTLRVEAAELRAELDQ